MKTSTKLQNTTLRAVFATAMVFGVLAMANQAHAQGTFGNKYDIFRVNDDGAHAGSEIVMGANNSVNDWGIYNSNDGYLHFGTVSSRSAFPSWRTRVAYFSTTDDDKRFWVNGRMRLGDHAHGTGIWLEGGTNTWFAGLEGDESLYRIYHAGNRFTVNTSGNGWFDGSLSVDNGLTVSASGANIYGNSTFRDNLTVNGTATFNSSITTGDGDNLSVGGYTTTDYMNFQNLEGDQTIANDGTLVFDFNFADGDSEYNVGSYFANGTGNDADLGGFAYYHSTDNGGGWGIMLSTLNMYLLKARFNTVTTTGAGTFGSVSTSGAGSFGSLTASGNISTTGTGSFDNGQVYTASNGSTARQYFVGSGNKKLTVGVHNNGNAFFWNEATGPVTFGVGGNEKMRVMNSGFVGIGTNDPKQMLHVTGNVRANKVEAVDVEVRPSGWADYVFADDYELKPLAEVKSYIEANNHLPDVPSAAQVEEEGISVAEMQKTMLQKIEELTLYVIELKEENEQLKAKVETIEASQQK